MIEDVREFLALFEGGPLPAEIRNRALMKSLDKLSCAYHETKSSFTGSEKEPPKTDYNEARALALKYFPDFGFYPEVSPLADIPNSPSVGDAIDDLADILAALREVLWRWENISPTNAEASFCESFEIHWGRHHLPPLRRYVSAQVFEY